jgi:hypothetical protein
MTHNNCSGFVCATGEASLVVYQFHTLPFY